MVPVSFPLALCHLIEILHYNIFKDCFIIEYMSWVRGDIVLSDVTNDSFEYHVRSMWKMSSIN